MGVMEFGAHQGIDRSREVPPHKDPSTSKRPSHDTKPPVSAGEVLYRDWASLMWGVLVFIKLIPILPITNGGDFARRLEFAVPVTGIKITGVVRCNQPRVIDPVARRVRKVDTLPSAIMNEVLAKVVTFFE
jgi:hypothetical protein